MEATMPRTRRPARRRKPANPTPDGAAYALPPLPSLLTRPLGLEGWTAYEPVLLAALATGEPMLLIGPHGTAKSFFLERLAQALALEYRFYNASLINYDDLVGIPMPNEARTGLVYLGTPTAIWEAEIVFVDELNRTRPELQNKLFPIIHERRVQGMPLERLRYRWAAMNPPPTMEGEDDELAVYLGAEPLDPALADRFPFVIAVPGWPQLSEEEKRHILLDQYTGEHPFPVAPTALIARAADGFARLTREQPAGITDYLLVLDPLLAAQGLACSTRRLTMLHRNILAVHAARVALYTEAFPEIPPAVIDWNASAQLALHHSLPQPAQGKTPDPLVLLAAHRQAWEVVRIDADNPWRVLLQIADPLERCLAALEMGDRVHDDDLSNLMLEALGSVTATEQRTATALAFYLACRDTRALRATVYETLAGEIRPVLQPRDGSSCPTDGAWRGRMRKARELAGSLRRDASGPYNAYAANLLMALIAGDAFAETTPHQACAHFFALMDRLAPAGTTTVAH